MEIGWKYILPVSVGMAICIAVYLAKRNRLEVTSEYLDVMDRIERGEKIILVHGSAGTGKSQLIKWIENEFKNKKIATAAPTGIAALNIGGKTIHTLFGFPPRKLRPGYPFAARNNHSIKELELLIIDEISMVRVDLMEAIDNSLKLEKGNSLPFGGAQVLLVGDLFQLPPVVDNKRKDHEFINKYWRGEFFFYSSSLLQYRNEISFVELTKVFRQKIKEDIALIQKIGNGSISGAELEKLNRMLKTDNDGKEKAQSGITLCAGNELAKNRNKKYLHMIKDELHTYEAEIDGDMENLDFKDIPLEKELKIKKGALVMFTVNDPGKAWVNGTFGIVKKIETMEGEEDDLIVIKIPKAKKSVYVQRYEYKEKAEMLNEIGDYEEVDLFRVKQYPLMLAWGVTIHKSQGKTMDRVNLDLRQNIFAEGQLYVAVSRTRRLSDICLSGKNGNGEVMKIKKGDIKSSKKVKDFLAFLRGPHDNDQKTFAA